tara:strand:+ start:858 stop:1043 length:186 start_codon:yes stop_codon:yes gene_type:complete
MKIIDLYPKEIKLIEVRDDQCLYCFAYIDIDECEIFCCEECQLAFDEENPEQVPNLKDIEL